MKAYFHSLKRFGDPDFIFCMNIERDKAPGTYFLINVLQPCITRVTLRESGDLNAEIRLEGLGSLSRGDAQRVFECIFAA